MNLGPSILPSRSGLRCLAVLWILKSATVGEVSSELGATYVTTQTFLNRLYTKKLVKRRMIRNRGLAWVYAPRISREEYARAALLELANVVYGGSMGELLKVVDHKDVES